MSSYTESFFFLITYHATNKKYVDMIMYDLQFFYVSSRWKPIRFYGFGRYRKPKSKHNTSGQEYQLRVQILFPNVKRDRVAYKIINYAPDSLAPKPNAPRRRCTDGVRRTISNTGSRTTSPKVESSLPVRDDCKNKKKGKKER